MNPKAKPRLGRGLSSLISVSDLPVEAEVQVEAPALPPEQAAEPTSGRRDEAPVPTAPPAAPSSAAPPVSAHAPAELPTGAIAPNPHQPRRSFDDASVAALAASIKSTGLVQPIIVKQVGEGKYELIAGERRLRAAKAAGLATIPALVREADPFRQAQMALIENIQREDLNPIDRAQAYRTLMDQLGLTQAELGNRLGEDRSSIANHLRLLDLAEPVRELVRSGKLSLGHAKILAGVRDPAHQLELAERVCGQDLSVRNLERVLEDAATPLPARPAATKSATPHIRDLEKRITSQLGLRVQLRSTGKKGKLIIHYGDLDQFDQILDRLGVQSEE